MHAAMDSIVRIPGAAGLCLVASLAAAQPVPVSDAGRRAQAPDVAIARDGSIHVVWLDKGPLGSPEKEGKDKAPSGHTHQAWADVYYARSRDGGRTFSAPVRVNAADGEVWGFAVSRPQVGVGPKGTVHVFYPANEVSQKTGKPVAVSHYARSTDDGRQFSKPVRVNGEPDQDLSAVVHGGLAQAHVFGTLAIGPEGDVYTFWLDTRIMTADWPVSTVYMAVSRDDGRSFEPERMIFGPGSCPCCQLTSAVGADGTVYLGGRTVSRENQRDATVAVSHDGGRTFADRVPVSGPRWIFDACPLKPTALAAEGAHLYTAVFNGAEAPAGVYFSHSGDGARSFDPAIKLHPDAGVSDAPNLVATPRALYAFWHARVGEGRRVYLRMSTDHGSTFGPVQELQAPPGTAGYPAAAGLPDGRALLVWQQGERILATVVDPPTRVAARKR